jgi:hypothetical protein
MNQTDNRRGRADLPIRAGNACGLARLYQMVAVVGVVGDELNTMR